MMDPTNTFEQLAASLTTISETEVAKRIASYAEAQYGRPYCPTCGGSGTVSEKRLVTPAEPTWKPYTTIFHAGTCPDCGGGKDPQQIAIRRAAAAGLEPGWLEQYDFRTWNPNKNPHLMDGYRQIVAWANNPRGTLLLMGPPGTGKTHLAIATAATALALGFYVRFTTTEELLRKLRATFDNSEGPHHTDVYAAWVTEPLLLVLDDVGREQRSEWATTTIENALAERMLAEKATVITTNDSLAAYGPRIESRLRDTLRVTRVFFEGDDMRPSL